MSFNITNIFKQTESVKPAAPTAPVVIDASHTDSDDGFEGVFRQATQAAEPETPKPNADAAAPADPPAEPHGSEASDQQQDSANAQDASDQTDADQANETRETSDASETQTGNPDADDTNQAAEDDVQQTDLTEATEPLAALTPAGLNNPLLQTALTGTGSDGQAVKTPTAALADLQQAHADTTQQNAGQGGDIDHPDSDANAQLKAETLGAALETLDEQGPGAEATGLDTPADDIDTLTLNNTPSSETTPNQQAAEAEAGSLASSDTTDLQSQSESRGDSGSPHTPHQSAVELQAARPTGFTEEASAPSEAKPAETAPTTGASPEGPSAAGRVIVETEASVARTPIVEAPIQPQAIEAVGSTGAANPIDDAPEEDNHRITQQAIRAARSVINPGGGSVTLRLNPQELGAIKVQLDLNNNAVRAQFTATNDAVRNILNQQMGSLRVALEGQGLSVESLSAQSSGSTTQQGPGGRDSEQTLDGRSRGMFSRQGSGGSGGQGDDTDGAEPSDFQRELLDLVG